MAIKTRQTTATGVTNNNAPLTNAELDNNFVELQQNKADLSGATFTGAIDVTGEVKADKFTNDEALPDVRPSLLLDFANSKTLDPRITFTRGSTATYWDGKTTAKAEENLITQSQNIGSTDWGKGRIVVTLNNATAPDGTTTASKLAQASGQTLACVTFQNTISVSSGDVITCSVYAKAGTNRNFLFVDETLFDGSYNDTWFNLSTGVAGTTDAAHTTSIEDVGSGWYRCSITVTANASRIGRFAVRCTDTDGSSTVTDDQGFIYAWGAQAEIRSSATAYTATTSSPVVKYQPVLQTAASGEARFDHDPVTGESKGLLIEEARTNFYQTSDSLNNNNSGIVTPDGAQSGREITRSAPYNFYSQYNQTSGTTFTVSVFAKAGLGNGTMLFGFETLNMPSGEDTRYYFDLTDGSINTSRTNSTANIEHVGNGWYRCSVTVTTAGSGYITMHIGNYGTDYQNSVHVYGLQLEKGAFPTSYIPTSGSTVTRSLDSAVMTGDNFTSFFSTEAFTLYREVEEGSGLLRSAAESTATKIKDSSGNNALMMRFVTDLSNPQADVILKAYGTTYADTADASISPPGVIRQAAALDATSLLSVATGSSAVATDLSVVLGAGHDRMSLCESPDQAWFRKIALYPKKLTSAQLSVMMEE